MQDKAGHTKVWPASHQAAERLETTGWPFGQPALPVKFAPVWPES